MSQGTALGAVCSIGTASLVVKPAAASSSAEALAARVSVGGSTQTATPKAA